MRILSSNGYVGIGTNAPNARLHLNTTSGTTPLRVQVNGSSKLLLSSNGGLSVGSATIAPANGLKVSGDVNIGTTSATYGYKMYVLGGGIKVSQYTETGDDDVSYGVYAEGATGVHGQGMTGISGDGMTGVEGTGYWGVYGYGSVGVTGYSEDGIGGSFESYSGNGLEARTTNGIYAGAFYGAVYLSSGYTTSDKNLKQNIQGFEGALGIINRLKPRQYEFKTDSKYAFLHLPKGSQYGLVAQDVEEVLPNLVSTANHIVKPESNSSIMKSNGSLNKKVDFQLKATKEKSETVSIKAVNYVELIPIMIKGMQELSEENETLKKQVADANVMKEELRELRQMVLELKNKGGGVTTTILGYVEQNTPNPVSGITTIRYHVPEQSTSAMLTLTNTKGQVVKTLTLGSKGAGQVNLNTQALAAGTYQYTLYVDGRQTDTKRLVIAR
jgi:hypothetical protein